MSRRRNRVVNTLGLASVPLSPAKQTAGYMTVKQLHEQDAREESERKAAAQREAEEELMAPVRAVEQELKQATKKQSEKIAAFYSKPLHVIANAGIDVAPNDPLIGDYPLQDGPKDAAADAAAYREFKSDLASHGCTLSPEGWQRLGGFLSVLHRNRNITLASTDSWAIGLERLASLGVFQEGELTGYQPRPQPVAQPVAQPKPLTFDEVLNTNSTESREGRQRIVAAAEKDHDKIAIPLFHEWARHLSRDYAGFTLSHEDAKYILEVMFPKNNWSFLRGENFNLARRAMVSQGRWPESMLTPVERITKELEDIPTSDYFRYREAKQRLRNAEAAEQAKSTAA